MPAGGASAPPVWPSFVPPRCTRRGSRISDLPEQAEIRTQGTNDQLLATVVRASSRSRVVAHTLSARSLFCRPIWADNAVAASDATQIGSFLGRACFASLNRLLFRSRTR